ncbi:MAG: hypothetical protein IV101_08870 [Dechloromonas sp.]|uniref:hypothetical protein n=1 Tax=Dechloromonas sp. TaxID=1917218 RepID=UPI0027F5E9EB|nr:hypothetical protein [Dechloromonas sp.]MBT9520995.1 hypothetical protein [Dechloromonas sp.]
MSKMNEYYEETRDTYLAAVIDGIETGLISQNDMEALLDLSGFEYLPQGGTSRWVQTCAKGA